MSNKIETELLEATGLKKKVGETFQKYADRLVTAVQELAEDDWEALSEDAQDWVNAGAKAKNADKDFARFPADEEPEDEPADEPDEKPARGRRAVKDEEEPADEPDEKPRRGRGRARDEEPDEPDEKPARGRRAAKEEPEDEPDEKPRGRRGRAEPEDEPEDKPARGRTRTRAAAEEPDEKPARKSAKKETKPAARGRKDPDAKAPSATTLLKKMLMKNPKMSTDEILAELEDKHDLKPTPMAVSSIRSAFIHSMRILDEHGYLNLPEKIAAKL